MSKFWSLAVPALLLLSSCHDDMDWKTVPGGEDAAVTRAFWRNSSELWLHGTDPTLVRDRSGAWTSFELCTEEGWSGGDFGFDTGDVVWALCSKLGATRSVKLLRFASDRSFAEVAFPTGETQLSIIQTGDTLRFAGKEQVYAREADTWESLGSHPFRSFAGGIGEGADDFYLEGELGDGVATVWHWDGQAFAQTALATTSTLQLRDGKLYAQASRVVAGALVAPPDSKDTLGRNIRFSSPLGNDRFVHLSMPPSTAFTHAAIGGVWLESAGNQDLEFLGHAPFDTGSLYGGGGISFFYAVDESTVLVGVAAGASGNGRKIVEGR